MRKYIFRLADGLHSLKPLFLGGVLLTCGDIVAGFWVREGGVLLLSIVGIFYLFGMIQLISSYRTKNIPVASTILIIFNVLILTVVGVVLFDESVTTVKISGLLLCIVSLVLIEFGKKNEI